MLTAGMLLRVKIDGGVMEVCDEEDRMAFVLVDVIWGVLPSESD
jgi:hypothetical protein